MEQIITSLIGGLCVGIPSLVATVVLNNKTQAVLEYKVDELDKKVHEHNNLIDRTYKLESRVTVLEEKTK
jgi:hypothetical protein